MEGIVNAAMNISEFIEIANGLNGIVIIPLHNSLKNFENIGHWNKYP